MTKAAAAFLGGDDTAADQLRLRFGLDRNDIGAVRLIGEVGARLGMNEAVAHLLSAAVEAAPAFIPARYHLAIALHRLGQNDAALAAIDRVLLDCPGRPAFLALRAAILMQSGREQQATEDLGAAVALDPAAAPIWHAYGHALRAVGDRAGAIAAYRRAIALAPDFGEAYWSLANLKAFHFESAEIDRMVAMLEREMLRPTDRSALHFALGKAMADARRDAEAFAHYRAGNVARRASEPWDAAAHSRFVRRTIATLDEAFFAARRGVGAGEGDPIFVLGMPRAGSTLVEQILASHSAVEGVSELPDVTAIARRLSQTAASHSDYPASLADLPLDRFADLGRDYLDRTRARRRRGTPYFVDKFPGNFLHAGLIHLMLPNAKIIDVRRHSVACCVSLYQQSFASGQAYSYDLVDLGRYFADYEALMRHFASVLPGRILRVSYEALVRDTAGEVGRLLDHCGLDFEPACLRFFETDRAIRTASSEQVRQPIFRDGLDHWRRFQPWLGPLIGALGSLAEE